MTSDTKRAGYGEFKRSIQRFDARPYIVLLFLVSIIAVPTLKNSFLFLDDYGLIVNNPKINFTVANFIDIFSRPLGLLHDKSFYSDFSFIYYRPALDVLYMANYTMWGLNPVGFHLSNLLLHLLTAFLVYRTGLIVLNADRTFSLIAAALFAVHPAHNELIGRVAMNENLLGFFIVSSFYFCLTGKRVLSLLTFSCALLSKESAVLFPLVALLFTTIRSDVKNTLKSHLPYMWVICVYAFIRILVVGIPEASGMYSPVESLLLFFSAFTDYLKIFFVPFNLSYYYPVWSYTSLLQPGLLPALLSCFVVVLLVWKIGVKKIECKLFLGAVIMLVPALVKANELILNNARAYIADRQLYIPSVFLVLMVSVLLIRYSTVTSRKYVIISAMAVITLFSFQTVSLCSPWESDDVLYQRFAHDYPQMTISHQYRGNMYLINNEYDRAFFEFEAALQTEQEFWAVADSHSRTARNSGTIVSKARLMNKYGLARYRPENAELQFLLGKVYLEKKDYPRAMAKFKVSLQLQPRLLDARVALAELYRNTGQINEARREYTQAMTDIRLSSTTIQ